VEKINASGGIDGRPIELVVRDDKGTAEGVRKADRELINSGVVAIIGHATNQQTKEALPIVNAAHVVLISPTAFEDDLNQAGGYFFKVINGIRTLASGYALSIYRRHGPQKIGLIYDTENPAAKGVGIAIFGDKYRALGGKPGGRFSFSSKAKPDFAPLIREARADGSEALMIYANTYDTALCAQRIRIMDWNVQMYAGGLAQVDPLIELGGKSVDGMEILQSFNVSSRSPEYLDFKKRYRKRFGQDPAPHAALAYETVYVLATGLKKTDGKREGLREALLTTKKFRGLADTFHFNNRGGAVRPFYMLRIENGKAVVVDTIKPLKEEGK
jgi:branched-chain amino acid transport system substrate-binding protein